ncbi:MAG: transporter substrate-binding domain-containing protein [Eggerthellaceae bacterium]|nr:transporter substrate-binding domain-containing protein [Eggerthellaceae bacterium]
MKKMKYLAVFAAAFALAAFVLVGCSSGASSSSASASASGSSASAASTSASAASASSDANKFIVGFDAEYPPYGFKAADGSYTGFDLDLAQAVCEMNGWEFEAKPIDWDAKDLELDSGNITCIWNGFTYEGREDKYAWSAQYMLNEQVFVVAEGSDVTAYENMGGKKVVTQAGSAAFDLLTDNEEHEAMEARFDGGKVATVPDYNTAFLQLESGAVDVVACDLSIAQYQIAQNPGKFVQLDEPLNSEHYAVGFKLGQDEMAGKVTESLKKLYEDGTVETLINKYSDYGMDINNWVLK